MGLKQFDRVAYMGPPELFSGIVEGDIGFIIEIRDEKVFEVEFSRADGVTYALHVIPAKYLASRPE